VSTKQLTDPTKQPDRPLTNHVEPNAAAVEVRDQPKAVQVRDPEQKALNAVMNALASVAPEARQRILRWANDKYTLVKPVPQCEAGAISKGSGA